MIPHKLRLRNFMCYREEQSLDFSGIHLACLAGDNGHGKSALLDAMTWALWGRARARRDDELITLDEVEMWVELEFDLNGQRYRVWRQRSRRGRGQSDLHFYVWDPTGGRGLFTPQAAADSDAEAGGWQLLDEGGLNERQALIIRTLRLDYETFVNSAFLLQGKADSFTVKTASERKQILADILGLARYDLYEQRAKEEAQARKELAARINGEIESFDLELGRHAAYEARLQAARATAAAAATALKSAEVEQAQARLSVQALQAQARQLTDLRQRLERAARDLAELRGQLQRAQARLEQDLAVIAQRDEIESGWAALQGARGDDAAWNARLLRHTALAEAASRAQLAVEQGRLTLEAELRRLTDRQGDLERKVATGKAQAEVLAEAQALLAQMAEQQARRDAIAAALREVGEQSATLKAENARIKTDGQALNDKAEMLGDAEAAACPLCEQPLTREHRDRMLADLAAEHASLADRYRANMAILKALAERKAALEAEDAALAHALRARDARQRQAAQADAAIAEAQAAAEALERLAQRVMQVSTQLTAREYALPEQAELSRTRAQMAESGYDAAAHEATRARVAQLAPFDARYQRQLIPALDGLDEAGGRVEALAAQITRRELELGDDQAEIARLAAAVSDLAQLEAGLRRADAEVERAAATERRARLEEGAALQQLAALTALAERRAARSADLDAVNAEFSIYAQLRDAFGKKGLQAMIIESAIPEVETEANQLLARMSEGRMALRLQTQREKVTGGMAETLDIIISDELGPRAYEMFSGGESFRANLALRIAISKLLARRAGAQLQTLVIDEGFGSQDAQGRSLVVEAINSIQHDFERILVITHIEELKDLFPARIDVVKTATGSQVRVV